MAGTVRGTFTTPAGDQIVLDWPLDLDLTPHCKVAEAANVSAEQEIKFWWNDTIRHTLDMFEDLRFVLNTAGIVDYMPLSSVERTKEYNEKIGGIPGSHHITGEAFDWNFSQGGLRVRMTNALRKQISAIWAYVCRKNGVVGYICWYTHGFHFDAATDGEFNIYDYRGTERDW